MKASGGSGTRWMTDLINTIVKEGCIPDDWRKSTLVPVYKGKGDPLVCGSYRAIKLLEQAMKVLERVRCQLITCNLASCLEKEPLMPFSSCDKYKRKTKQRRRRCTTHIKQHRSKRVQPNGSPCANNHCSTRYEQSFRHNKHTHTNQKAATDKHSRHNH